MNVKILLAAALAVGLPRVALAADKDASQDAPKEKKVCRTETLTGSLISRRRVCMTEAQWQDLAEKTRQDTDKFLKNQNRPQPASNPLGG